MRMITLPALTAGLLLLLAPQAGAQDVGDAQSPPAEDLLVDGMTREELVSLYRSLTAGAFEPPACVAGGEMFTDVPATNPFCPWIEELARRGITSGCTPTTYCPGSPVTRSAMAIFIVKAMEAGPTIITSEQGIVPIEPTTTDTVIDTLVVEAGSWMVFASVSIQNLSIEDARGRCRLFYPGDSVGYAVDYESVHAGHSLQLPVLATGVTTITLACNRFAGSARTLQSQITANRAGNLLMDGI